MNQIYIKAIAAKLQVKEWQVENCVTLFDDGATIPFISRYRKEATGGMTDVEVAEVNRLMEQLQELDKRHLLSTLLEITSPFCHAIQASVELQKVMFLMLQTQKMSTELWMKL